MKVVFFFGTRAKEEHACLSNFFRCQFIDADGRTFHSAEQAMMLGKALVFEDERAAESIMQTRQPFEAKQLGRQVRGFDQKVWAERARQVVEQACFNKFAQNRALRDVLLSTGDALLVEASPHDTIWGIGLNADQARCMPQEQWPGTNWLGLVLCAVRERLRSVDSADGLAPVSLLARPPPPLASPEPPAREGEAPAHTHLLVMDFEATCERGVRNFPNEIIELPAVLLDARSLEQVGEFRQFVRPTERPALSAFCTELTSITQEQVDAAAPLAHALRALECWLEERGLSHGARVLPVTCGDWDLGRQLPAEAARKRLAVPGALKRWCNIKRVYEREVGAKAPGMAGMLRGLGLPLVGRHHLGIDDARNIAAIVRALGARGAPVEQTGGTTASASNT